MKKGGRWRTQLLSLTVLLLIIAAGLWYFLGAWVYQPLLLIGFSILGTQCGAEFGRRILSNLATKISQSAKSEEVKVTDESQQEEPANEAALNEVVLSRVRQSEGPAGAALNSYLSQVVGTFAMAVLVIGLCVLIFVRAQLGDKPQWMGGAAFVVALIVLGIFMWIILGEPFYKCLAPYYDWHNFFPPLSALTVFRISVLLIYSALVFMLYYPNLPTSTRISVPPKEEVRHIQPEKVQ